MTFIGTELYLSPVGHVFAALSKLLGWEEKETVVY